MRTLNDTLEIGTSVPSAAVAGVLLFGGTAALNVGAIAIVVAMESHHTTAGTTDSSDLEVDETTNGTVFARFSRRGAGSDDIEDRESGIGVTVGPFATNVTIRLAARETSPATLTIGGTARLEFVVPHSSIADIF